MSSLWTRAVATLGVAAAASGAGVVLDERAGPWEFVFGTVVTGCALVVGQIALAAGSRARSERARAGRLAAIDEREAARRAVVAERVRLAADTEAIVRASVTTIGALADAADRAWDDDPVPLLRAVQEHGARASEELRRMLGLLREAAQPLPWRSPPPPDDTGTRIRRTDVGLAIAAAVLAVSEAALEGALPHPGTNSVLALALTALTAATVVGYRTMPGLGAGVAGALLIGAALLDVPPNPGLWMVALAALAWSGAARGTPRDAIGAVTLVAAVAVATGWRDPENAPFTVAFVAAGLCGGALVGWLGGKARAAERRAAERAGELADLTGQAVFAERVTVARDLHDVVSNAVGVLVMQAGAAEALRPAQPERARAALAVVRRCSTDALGELDRLVAAIRDGAVGAPAVAGGVVTHEGADMVGLVDRMRAAGLDIRFTVVGEPSGECASAAYRIVQESLTNAARHAPGSTVSVAVSADSQGLTVDVADDGPGSVGGTHRGYGLVGIEERVHRLGGAFATGAAANGRGFRVVARLPIDTAVGA